MEATYRVTLTEQEIQSRYEAARIIRDRLEGTTNLDAWMLLNHAREYLYVLPRVACQVLLAGR